METKENTIDFENGTIHFLDRSDKIQDSEWKNHPQFKGVFLKHLIKGEDTSGLFSAHLVKIEPGCCLEPHIHDTQLELHEVINGQGICKLAEEQILYHSGQMAVISKGSVHMVRAGDKGLTLMAKFFPALI